MHRIRHAVLAVISLALVVNTGCISFNTAYERIDADATRLLSMQLDPPEALPGDTVLVTCIFAGEPVAPSDVQWTVSYKILTNDYGMDTAVEIHSLDADGIVMVDSQFSPSTYTVAFRMQVPRDIIAKSPSIPENWTTILGSQASGIPPEVAQMSKSDVLSLLDGLATAPPEVSRAILDSIPDGDMLVALASQIFTVRLRLFGNVRGGAMSLERNCRVRYCNALARIPGVPLHVNHNPTLDSARILKVTGAGLSSFVPGVNSQAYEAIKVYDSHSPSADTASVLIDKNYSYFVEAFGAGADSLNLLSLAFTGEQAGADSVRENLGYQWFFRVDSATAENVKPSDLPAFSQFGFLSGAITSFIPAMDARVTSVRWWVQVYDQYTIKEISRPQGCSLHEMNCKFEYTKAYLDYVKK